MSRVDAVVVQLVYSEVHSNMYTHVCAGNGRNWPELTYKVRWLQTRSDGLQLNSDVWWLSAKLNVSVSWMVHSTNSTSMQRSSVGPVTGDRRSQGSASAMASSLESGVAMHLAHQKLGVLLQYGTVSWQWRSTSNVNERSPSEKVDFAVKCSYAGGHKKCDCKGNCRNAGAVF